MYKRILITNRADCAVRLIQACHNENIHACLAASRDDAQNIACQMADDVIFTGLSRDAYTNQDDILEAARKFACEAILPGWGFLSEDYAFARRCRLMGFHFVGPSSKQLQIFGDKLKTIQLFSDLFERPQTAICCGLPDADARVRQEISGPIMLKPRFGGGGKNITRCASFSEFCQQLEILRKTHSESLYFAEPAIDNARHVEVQFLGDGTGNVLFLGARDCTPQKFHQKYFESSIDLLNAPEFASLAERIRSKLAIIRYKSWGTVELLIADDRMHMLELNPRLQVEHGVTELVSGIDIVRSALRTECTGRLELCQSAVINENCASCEFRLFARSAGTLKKIGFPGFVWPNHPFSENPDYRIESAYRIGDSINGAYDGLIARFILRTQNSGIRDKMRKWLANLEIEGLDHNLGDL